jgi:hypothetical protein
MCAKSLRSSRAPDQIAVEVVAAAFRPAAFAHRNDEKDARLKAAATKARFCPAIRRERLPPARSFLRVKRRPLQNHRRPTFRRGGEAQARNIRRQKRRQAAALQTARALETQLSALDELSPSIYAGHSPATRCGTRKTRMLARPYGIVLRQAWLPTGGLPHSTESRRSSIWSAAACRRFRRPPAKAPHDRLCTITYCATEQKIESVGRTPACPGTGRRLRETS